MWSAVWFTLISYAGALRSHLGNVSGEKVTHRGKRDLVFMHIPFNFGHTIEKVAMFDGRRTNGDVFWWFTFRTGDAITAKRQMSWKTAEKWRKPGGEVWGHFNPDLQIKSKVTGCSMYFTPPKYWPQDLAKRYFGNGTTFGLLRDPYERLVALFRGNVAGYGGSHAKFIRKCDVNGAVKDMMQRYMVSKDRFSEECTFLPQAEYFEGPHGVSLPVDNLLFPDSMNKVFAEHGYDNMHIRTADIQHVTKCTEAWAGDLDAETRALVRKVYAKDFELLCRHFGYCGTSANTCIAGVPGMCPKKAALPQLNGTVVNDRKGALFNVN